MSQSFEKFQKRRLISSYVSAIVSIGLVLFLLGFLGLILMNSKKVADHFKEHIALTVFLKDDARSVEIEQFQQTVQLADYTKSAVFVSKEQVLNAIFKLFDIQNVFIIKFGSTKHGNMHCVVFCYNFKQTYNKY